MGGISGSGLISGIDTQGLINSLLGVAARPRTLAQGRLFQLQTQQAAYFDLNSRLGALKTAAAAFRVNNVFDAKTATSTNPDVLTATASLGAQPGSYSFIVDRLVSSQQQLSRGFQDFDTSAIGASSFTFESTLGRLDQDLSLNALNNGDGVVRGNIRISDGVNPSVEVDLSRAGTVNEVIDAINNSGLDVTARVRDGRFEIVGATSVTNTGTADVAGSLGLSTSSGASAGGGVLTGATVYSLSGDISLTTLNDGNGVSYNSRSAVVTGIPTDFTITIETVGGPVEIDVGLGELREVTDDNGTPGDTSDDTIEVTEPAVSTVQGVLDRINNAFNDAGIDAAATIDGSTGGLALSSNEGDISAIDQVGGATTVRDLGLEVSGLPAGAVSGSRVFSGLGTVLLSNLNGGGSAGGISGNGQIGFTVANGNTVNIDLDLANITTFEELIDAINQDAGNGGEIVASLNENGTGLKITDTTTGVGNLIVADAVGSDTAASLGILTAPGGVDAESLDGTSLQRRYVGEGTRLDTLRNGDGIGTGRIRLIDGSGSTAEIAIGDDIDTIGDLLTQVRSSISSSGLNLSIDINDQGDGLVISDTSGGGQVIRVEDIDGTVAANLRLEGESGTGIGNAFIDGSYETTVDFDPTDTLEDIIDAINNADAGVAVSVLNDGSGTRPFRLSLTSRDSGEAGRFILDTNGFDLGLTTLDDGEDARVIFGSNDASSGILLTSSTNTLDNVITGVTIDLSSASDDPVTVSITDDTSGTEETINTFIEAYNDILSSIENSTRFDSDTGERGALLGDGLLLGLRQGLFGAVQNQNSGFSGGFSRLLEVGISIGSEGRLEFDRDEFRSALEENPEAVQDLFTRRLISDEGTTSLDLPDGVTVNDPNAQDIFLELGVIGQIEEFAKNYTDSIDGIITSRTQSLDTQILSQQGRIERLTEGLDRERARLERQFVGMEQALAQLQSQQSALSSLFALG